MPDKKGENELVVVWRNKRGGSIGPGGKTEGYIHRDTDAGGLMMKPGAAMVMTKTERDVRGRPPSSVGEEVMTRREAMRRYGKKPTHGE